MSDGRLKSLDRRSFPRAQAQAKRASADLRIGLALRVGLRWESERRAADRVSPQAQSEKASAELLSPSPGLQTPRYASPVARSLLIETLWARCPGPVSFGAQRPLPRGHCLSRRWALSGCVTVHSSGSPCRVGTHLFLATPRLFLAPATSASQVLSRPLHLGLPTFLELSFSFQPISNPEACLTG